MPAAGAMRLFRTWLTAGLVGLVMLLSGGPCAAFAAPAAHPVLAAPLDPCLAGKGAASAPVCAQCACQQMGQPPASPGAPPPRLSRAQFDLSTASLSGRLEAPPIPPPRHPMS
jgi:hypothetical protein